MEQMEFDVRLESDRELEENVNVALDFACKQVRANTTAEQRCRTATTDTVSLQSSMQT